MADFIAAVLMSAGLFFLLVGAIGLVRLPDFYTRLHAASLGDTLGLTLFLVGLMVHEGVTLTSFKMLIIELFMLLASPTATHVLIRAAYQVGLKPWTREEG
ncbi:MAG: multicomponent Na+:H+ antiporter subunit [Clostridia bacterium]|nr:multicomponent Na+:H+ antiporter subunit [Clostridia bacterium]